MKVASFGILLAFFWILGVAASPSNSGKKASDQTKVNKAEQLRQRALASSDHIIELTAENFKYFIEEGPRPYDVVVLFVADNNEMCKQVYSEYQVVAEHFKNKLVHFTQKEDGKIKRPVFFATVKHNSGTAKLFR